MTSNNYNYGGNYPPINNRVSAPQQSFATSSATAADPYYGAQSSATPTRTYPNNDYQYQQYPQQSSANNGGGYNWGVYSGGKAAPATGMESLGNPSVPEQTPNTTTKSNAHNSYDTSGLGNLAYASGLNYNSVAETAQSTARYSGANVYEGGAKGSIGHQSTPSQIHDRAKSDNTSSRASPVAGMHSQRYAPEPAAGMKSGAAYNLPTPSPAYPQSLINSYPQRSNNTTTPSGGTSVASRAPDTMEVSSRNLQQRQYTPFTPSQPQKPATAKAFKPEQNRQASTPPVAPTSRGAANTSSNAYINQSRSQAARGPNTQSGRAIQNSPPPAAILPPAKMSTNVTRRMGDGQMPTTQNINNQPNQYQPAPTSQLPQTSNYLPLPTQGATARNQQLPQPQRQPSPDIPTTVDPSHVYNSYHEYQKQIEAAEAALLARLKEMEAAEEQLRQEALRVQQQRERADRSGAAVQVAMTLTHTMSTNAAESESESEESEEDEQGQDSNDADGDNEDRQQINAASTSENTSHPISVAPASSKGKAPAPSIPAQVAEPQEPPNGDTAVTMEEEMRRMVERLRDYQSKDPKLFLQVWSSVRKTSTEQSPQLQAEGSQSQGSPVTQQAKAPLQSPTSSINQLAAPPKATVPPAPVSAPAPTPASRGKKAMQQSPDSSKSPSTQAKPVTKDAVNAKRRAKRSSRSKAALAARAEAERAEAEAKAAAAATAAAATTAIPAAQQPALATPGKPSAVESHGNSKSTTSTPGIASIVPPPKKASPAVANNAAKTTPINNAQQTPAALSQATGRAQHASPAANPRPPQQGSTWPTDKRDAIAITAANVLNEIPENAGKKILARQIRDMLEGNPSYLELCEMIEKLGFKMDRARFAKTLLAVLPGNTKSKPQTPRVTAVTPVSGQTASAPQAQASQQKTPQPILPPTAGVAARQPAIRPPVTPGTTQTPPQADQTPGSETPMNGMERRPVGRPRRDGLPAGSPYANRRSVRGPARPRNDGQPVPSPARLAAERLENQVSPVAIAQELSNATATATTTAAGMSAPVTTAPSDAPAQPHLPTVATASANTPGSQSPQLQSPPISATTDTPGQPNLPPASQGPGDSSSLSTEEMHHMALLKAYVGKSWRASVPGSPTGGPAKTYLSPYQNEVAPPPPKGGWKTWRDSTTTQTHSSPATTQAHPYPPTTQAHPYPPTTQSHPYPPTMQAYPYPTAPRVGPGPVVHYNSQSSAPSGPPQYGPPQYGPFQPVAYPYHHHGNQPPPLPPNVRIIPDQSALSPNVRIITDQLPVSSNVRIVTGQSSVSQPAWAPAIPAAPLTKEAQARKRTFAEIIDLTKGESLDKGEEPSEKRRQRIDPSAAGDRINSLSALHGRTTGEVPTRLTQPNAIPFQHHQQHYANTPSHNITKNITVNPQAEVTRNPLLEYDGIVKSIDRSLALRKSRYDPKTIARDILISIGKHPSQRSLNSHLEQLKRRFTKVDNTSDLSTFRWDIVDPGGAAVGSANMPPSDPNKPVTDASHQKYGPSRPSGLRNETSQANSHIVIIDDSDVDEEMGEDATAPAGPTAPAPKRRGRPPRDPNAIKPTPAKRILTRTRRNPNSPTAANGDFEEPEQLSLPPPKRRGRPPRNPAKEPGRPHSRLGQPRYQPFLCEWRGCKAELQNLETLRRHVYIVHGKPASGVEFGARPCLWGKCGRGGRQEQYGEGDVEMDGARLVGVFRDEEAFRAHLEKAHIVPMAWHMGDGPRGSIIDGSESDHSSYLNSPLTGRRVTPSIATQTVTSVLPARRRGRPPAAGREPAEPELTPEPEQPAKREWTQWEYWCGPEYVLKSMQLGGESAYKGGGWRGGEEELEEGYGDEMRSAARVGGKAVYAREMPGEMRGVLGV
ncbi:hypothetical protein VE03_05512 [Pseudogymnoascus sp. 23342-1-I1]|nr:hypothetical protein VE03_05512 [Pseudogymnoascus sp. 23342-1-I1]